jgi:protein-tyrosine phosphatase
MLTELFRIPTPFSGQLAIAPRPRGGDWLEDEMRNWREAGIDTVVSLLTPDEASEFELTEEAAVSSAQGVKFVNYPVPDRGLPASRQTFRRLVHDIAQELSAGHGVAIHCRQGIGRAALVALGVLVAGGFDPEVAIERVSAVRGRSVPETQAQKSWFEEFALESTASTQSI